MAGAIARLGREGRAAFGRRFDSCLPRVNCFKCLKDLPPVFEHDWTDNKTPNGGLIFSAAGNYGSRIYDPTMSAPMLVVWICDGCIVANKELVEVRSYAHVETQIIWRDYDPEMAYW